MKRLYVGCRVRIVGVVNFKSYLGKETRIVGWFTGAWDGREQYDGWELECATPSGYAYVAKPDHLEPIQDPGHQACDEDFKRDLDKLLERQGVVA